MSKLARIRTVQWFLPLFLAGIFLCPCHGFGAMIETAEETTVSCCEHCAHHEDQGEEAPKGVDSNCDCTVGCCQIFVVPDSDEADTALSFDCFQTLWIASLSEEWMLECHPMMESYSDPPGAIHRGTLFPDSTNLLL